MPLVTERNFNGVQTFDSRYIDKSRLETLLKALYNHSPYSVKRQLNEWRVEAPQPLDPVCIVLLLTSRSCPFCCVVFCHSYSDILTSTGPN